MRRLVGKAAESCVVIDTRIPASNTFDYLPIDACESCLDRAGGS